MEKNDDDEKKDVDLKWIKPVNTKVSRDEHYLLIAYRLIKRYYQVFIGIAIGSVITWVVLT